ncbi:MAG: YbhB/YbcL family Raf kinase inhibitor-like protein [Coxiellaceae bacterium]|nr:YbhB/YbcL family Raf kinase inhibitor-like protein [Coxiellaceae bacterium]
MVKMLTFLAFLMTHGQTDSAQAQDFNLYSAAFKDGSTIPALYTCKDKDYSLPVHWSGVPKTAQSLALVMDDPDAPNGVWYHWALFNINPQQTRFTAHLKGLPDGVTAAKNSWGVVDYRGPCPPQGKHHYVLRLYALDKKLAFRDTITTQSLIRAMRDHVVGVARLGGTVANDVQR